jgi:hypothetical protein
MPVSYRAIASIVNNRDDIQELVLKDFYTWLRKDPPREPRNFNIDRSEMNTVISFSPKADLTLLEKTEIDRSKTLRARLVEIKPDDTGEDVRWVSTLTLHMPVKRENRGFMLFEIDSALEETSQGFLRARKPGTPNFLKKILSLDELEFMDGDFARFTTEPRVLNLEDVEFLENAACDPLRISPLVVMGTDKDKTFDQYLSQAKDLTKTIVGTASSYVLTPEATQEFNRIVNDSHAVYGGNIRTYMPVIDPAVPIDARRHPYIRKLRIQEMPVRAVQNTLEWTTRNHLLDQPLPKYIQRIDRRITEDQNALIINGQRILAYTPTNAQPAAKLPDDDMVLREGEILTREAANYLELINHLKKDMQVEHLSIEVISDVVTRFRKIETITELLAVSDIEKYDLKNQIDTLKEELLDSSLGHSETYEEVRSLKSTINSINHRLLQLSESENDIKVIKRELNAIYHSDSSWLAEVSTVEMLVPRDFQELIESIGQLVYVRFTGEQDEVEELSKSDLGAWCGKTWDGLETLNEYARAKSDGKASESFYQFLKNSPNGYLNNWSLAKYAAKDSESTMKSPAKRKQRELPVPTEVNPSGLVLMESHLSVNKNLRVHFYDDTANTGKIYVGYIGRHLDTSSTN